jgi:hypothetical protein
VFKNDPAEFRKYFRDASCSEQGGFRFGNLAAGDYYLIAGVVGKESVHSLNHGYLMKRVTATEGTDTKVELHR